MLSKKEENIKGKCHVELLPYSALRIVADAFHSGNAINGYKPNDWAVGRNYSAYFGAAIRHIWEWWLGSRKDKVSGIHPLAHAIACLLILLYFELHKEQYKKKKIDDRVLN